MGDQSNSGRSRNGNGVLLNASHKGFRGPTPADQRQGPACPALLRCILPQVRGPGGAAYLAEIRPSLVVGTAKGLPGESARASGGAFHCEGVGAAAPGPGRRRRVRDARALVDGGIYRRTGGHLYCFGRKPYERG